MDYVKVVGVGCLWFFAWLVVFCFVLFFSQGGTSPDLPLLFWELYAGQSIKIIQEAMTRSQESYHTL